MPDRVRKIRYCYVKVPNRAGQGEKVLGELEDAGVDLVGYMAFPVPGRKSQLDFITDDVSSIRKVARKNGWRLSRAKKGFWVEGTDKIGAVHRQVARLAERKINATAGAAVYAGGGRYGMLLWVKDRDYARAARALKAR